MRAITKEHGSLVDRYTLMARSATRGFFIVPDASLMQQFQRVWQQVIFDWRLWYVCHPPLCYAVVSLKKYFYVCVYDRFDGVQMRLAFWGLRVLHWLGRAPDMSAVFQMFR